MELGLGDNGGGTHRGGRGHYGTDEEEVCTFPHLHPNCNRNPKVQSALSPGCASPAPGDSEELEELYRQHNPAQVAKIPQLLSQWKGNAPALIAAIKAKCLYPCPSQATNPDLNPPRPSTPNQRRATQWHLTQRAAECPRAGLLHPWPSGLACSNCHCPTQRLHFTL